MGSMDEKPLLRLVPSDAANLPHIAMAFRAEADQRRRAGFVFNRSGLLLQVRLGIANNRTTRIQPKNITALFTADQIENLEPEGDREQDGQAMYDLKLHFATLASYSTLRPHATTVKNAMSNISFRSCNDPLMGLFRTDMGDLAR